MVVIYGIQKAATIRRELFHKDYILTELAREYNSIESTKEEMKSLQEIKIRAYSKGRLN